MYDKLIEKLRDDTMWENCEFDFIHSYMREAADAIEELKKQLQKSEVDNINLTGWLAEEHAKVEELQKKYDETQDALITSELTKIYLSDVLKYIKLLLEKGKDRANSQMRSIFPMPQESQGETMTKHDRLMNALAEIKAICSRHGDYEIGCGKQCPFLMGEDGDYFRGCEVMVFTRQAGNAPIDTPEEWGEPPESEET